MGMHGHTHPRWVAVPSFLDVSVFAKNQDDIILNS